MAIVSKTDRNGVDVAIEKLQQLLYPRLISRWDVSAVYTSHPRANKNKIEGDLIPEVSLDSKEYKEVFTNDNVAVNSFWLVDNVRPYDPVQEWFSHNVSLIFQADLVKLYGQSNRADEEFKNAIQNASKNYGGWDDFELIGVETGVDNVYREFITDQIRFTDMSEMNVVRFNYMVKYTPECT